MKLKTAIYKKGYRREWIAKELGVSKQTFDAYCSGRSSPRMPVLKLLAQIIGVEVDDLLKREAA